MDKRLSKILEAIDELFSDTSVTQEQTLDWMHEIKAEVENKIQCVTEDKKRDRT